jgi:hypothetical protein
VDPGDISAAGSASGPESGKNRKLIEVGESSGFSSHSLSSSGFLGSTASHRSFFGIRGSFFLHSVKIYSVRDGGRRRRRPIPHPTGQRYGRITGSPKAQMDDEEYDW